MGLLNLPSFENLPMREEVLRRLFTDWNPELRTEMVPVEEALGRVTAEECRSLVSLPMVRASAGDGVAVDSVRFVGGAPDTSDWTLGRDFVRADTGDDFNDRFDAVIFIEDVDLTDDGRLRIHDGVEVRKGFNVRPSGSLIDKGDLLVPALMPLRPRDLAGLHMGGVWDVRVLKKPAVAFIPTGSELVAPRGELTRGKNIDANSVLAQATLQLWGADPILYPIVRDDKAALEEILNDALRRADIVVLNGGSSKGGEDYNARLLRERGRVLCHGAAAAPGKPLCLALAEGKPVVNLPGPFIAAYHGFEWCIGALVARCLRQHKPTRRTLEVTLAEEISGPKDVSFLCSFDVGRDREGAYVARPIDFKRTSMGRTVAANAQYMTPLGGGRRPAGDRIVVELLRPVESIPDV